MKQKAIFLYTLLLGGALFLQPLAGDARHHHIPAQPVTVEQEPPVTDITRFDPAHPPDPPPPIPRGLNAATGYDFLCHQQSWLQDVSEFTDRNGTVHVQERPDWFKIKLTLSTLTWLPNSASDKLKEHEVGHVAIYKALYEKRAVQAAKESAEKLVGQIFEGSGPDEATARNEIQHKVTSAVCSAYHEATRDMAAKADASYDALTDHGRNGVATDAAVKQTLDEFVESSPNR